MLDNNKYSITFFISLANILVYTQKLRFMFTLKTLCKALVITVFSLNLSSCSNDDEADFTNYKLQTVKWKLDTNDTEKINVIELPPTIDLNQTDESIYATFTVADKIEEISQFFCDNPKLFNALISQDTILWVCISNDPSDFSSQYKELSSPTKAPFNLNINVVPSLSNPTETIEIVPYTKVTTRSMVTTKTQSATYLATFTSNNGDIIEITGKWERVTLQDVKASHVFEDIK